MEDWVRLDEVEVTRTMNPADVSLLNQRGTAVERAIIDWSRAGHSSGPPTERNIMFHLGETIAKMMTRDSQLATGHTKL